jgi:hypothetical protein
MVAVKRGLTVTTRTILEFGVKPAIFLSKDADGSTPLHRAVQDSSTVLAKLLIQFGSREQLYTENCVGQTPLEVAGLKFLPRVTGSNDAPRPSSPHEYIETQVYTLNRTAPFDVEKQKVEIPKLRATLDMLIADSRLVPGTKLATELLAFADRMEEKLAIETAPREDVAKDVKEDDEVDPPVAPRGTTADVYLLLRDVAASRPGPRHLVHLSDVQRSVQQGLAREASTTLSNRIRQISESQEEKRKQTDPEEQRIAQLKERSLFSGSANRRFFGPSYHVVRLFGDEPILAPIGQVSFRQVPAPRWRSAPLFW